MSDQQRTCLDCGARFSFRAGEQRFFSARGLPDAPVRCGPCRRARKIAARSGPVAATARERVPAQPRSTREQARERELPACAWCGAPARVPFEVATHRPVACEACYRWRLGVGSGLVEG